MKKYIGPIILIASIAGIGWLMLKRTANKVYVSLASVQFGSISALSIPFTLSINLVNDNDYPVNAGRLIGKLFYKNNFISDFSSENINILPSQVPH
jgi:type III secretory pathway lipoprotein EscJ